MTCENDDEGAKKLAEEIADDIWERRREALNPYLTVTEAASVASTWNAGTGPLIIADYADNPGSGAYGDSTALLSALLSANIKNACFGPMVDAAAALQLQHIVPGESVTLSIGGKIAPEFGGGPIEVTGTVQWYGEGLVVGSGPIMGGQQRSFGTTAVLRVDEIDILIVSIAHQILDLSQFETFGIDPQQLNVVALRSMQHFRAAFTPIAGRIVICDSGALCTVNYSAMPYQHVPRPVYPLDDDPQDNMSKAET